MSSIVSFQGTPWSAHYSATKAYVQVLAEGLRAELKPKNIDLLAVAPGPTKTGFASRANMKMGAALDPTKIAPEILSALGRKTTVLPGFLSKLLVYSMLPLPRWARIAIMGKVMRGMASTKPTLVPLPGHNKRQLNPRSMPELSRLAFRSSQQFRGRVSYLSTSTK